jgi:hypothetical protein
MGSNSDSEINIDSVVAGIKQADRSTYNDAVEATRRLKIENDGAAQFFNLQEKWSRCIILWITFILAFNFSVILFIGFGVMIFKDNVVIITAITEGFLQILGMGFVAVKCFHPYNKK